MSTLASNSVILGFTPQLQKARLRALGLGRAVLASLTVPWDDARRPCLGAGSDAFLWEQPSRGVYLLGIGEAAAIDSQVANRFGHVREGLTRILAEAVVQGGQPLALAGFAFDREQPREERWQEFPDGLAVLPRLLFSVRDGLSTLTLNALVTADADVTVICRELEHELDRALVPSKSTAGITAGAGPESEARERWLANVADLTRLIAAGEADKVVLARRLDLQANGCLDPDSILNRLRLRYPDTTLFAVRRGAACFLGATPETLVSLDGNSVRADCLAGSYPRGATPDEDEALGAALLNDEKERREHEIVAAELCNSLRGVCSDLQLPEAPVLRRMANVQHLHTPIQATTDGRRHVLELVQRVHPTPATAGLPRERSLCLIRRHESFSRGWYAGPIGWLNADGNGEFAVALRSALINGLEVSLYAGCGIVSGSDPAREYDESAIKLQAMLWALDVAPAAANQPTRLHA